MSRAVGGAATGIPLDSRRRILFWVLAFAIMVIAGAYQRRTGPTYELKGRAAVGDVMVRYELTRTHPGAGDQEVRLPAPVGNIQGTLIWKRHGLAESWQEIPMSRDGEELVGFLPHQPPAGKLDYRVRLDRGSLSVMLPATGFAVTRFRGDVPATVLISHILFMFVGLMFSTRAGIEALAGGDQARRIALQGFVLLIIGGMILGPLVQKFSFGVFWAGVPFGWDLTDNKTLIFVVVWGWALGKSRGGRPARWALAAASAITLLVYLIPHSMLGSELDYSQTGT
jgi:hypothetical protein